MDLVDELQALIGADGVLHEAAQTAPFLTDWRGRFRGQAVAVVQPRTAEQTAQVVNWCARHGVAVVPQGGNTGLVGGATPDPSGRALVLSTRRMNRIRELDCVNDTITAEAGCALAQLQQAAASAQRLFPLSMASEGSCTIGGNLASNAGGTQVLRYGNTRELTLGLEVVLADGSLWSGLRALRKDNSGYDLKQLFIGSEGTLGIITAATVRLFPAPRVQLACLLALRDLAAAQELLQRARASAGPSLTAFELLSRSCVELVEKVFGATRATFAQAHDWYVLLEWTDHEDSAHAARQCENLCTAAMDAGLVHDAIVSLSLADSAALWQLRERIPEAQARTGGNVKHDISLPLGAMEDFVRETEEDVTRLRPELQTFVFGHLGDGNLHFNVGTREPVPASTAFEIEAQINEIVYRGVVAHAGSISAEHGIGQLRRALLGQTRTPLEMGMMRAIKRALDPRGLMNPGKVL